MWIIWETSCMEKWNILVPFVIICRLRGERWVCGWDSNTAVCHRGTSMWHHTVAVAFVEAFSKSFTPWAEIRIFYSSPLQILCLVKTKYKCWILGAVNNPSYIHVCTLKTMCTDLSSQPIGDSSSPKLQSMQTAPALYFCALKLLARKTWFFRNFPRKWLSI